MAEVDQEFDELLSAYVDGELSADEELRVRQRLETEPQVVAAVEALRADRRARAALWQSCEPDEAAVQRLIDRVDQAVDRQTVWSHRLSQFRGIAARGVGLDPAGADEQEAAQRILEVDTLPRGGQQVAHAEELEVAR